MSADLPWFPFHVERFTGSRAVRGMSSEQVGIYVLLIAEEWMRGPLPTASADLAVLTPSPVPKVRVVLRKCFRRTDAGWVNDTIEEVRIEQQEKAKTRSRAGKAGAKARWDKGENGDRIATALRPQSDTNGNRREEKRIEENRREREARAPNGPVGDSKKAVEAYLGEYAHAGICLPEMAAMSIKGLYLPLGTQERVWGSVPDDKRPAMLATALLRWSGENHPEFNSRLFLRIIEAVISEGATDGYDPDDGFWDKVMEGRK